MAEELKTVESTTAVGQENAPKATTPETIDDSILRDTSIARDQDLSAFSHIGINGLSLELRMQAGQRAALSFVRGKEFSQGVKGGSELLQQEYGVSDVVIGMETSIKSPTLSSGLQHALKENPDYLFQYSPLRKLEFIKFLTGESIVREHHDLQAVMDLANGYIPKVLPGKFPKHQLPSLGNVRDGDVASAIAEDTGVVAKTKPGPRGIVRDNPEIAEEWEESKMDARAAA